jgi:hypothetical protein
MRILGRLDPILATVIRWVDEDPAAMRRLLKDDGLRAQLAAVHEVDQQGKRPSDEPKAMPRKSLVASSDVLSVEPLAQAD